MNEHPDANNSLSRVASLSLAAVIIVSVTGYFIGIRQNLFDSEQFELSLRSRYEDGQTVADNERGHQAEAEHEAESGQPKEVAANGEMVPQVVGYTQMNAKKRGPNRDIHFSLETLTAPTDTVRETARPADNLVVEKVMARSLLRAFDGAPPVVPHPVDQRSSMSCLTCHGPGVTVGNIIAPKMSHQTYTNCLQCHVENSHQTSGLKETLAPTVASSGFAGLASSTRGSRAYPGAPPTIPHSTWMRGTCLSCHSASGTSPLRTSHPNRQSCTQCHAPSAALDQVPFAQKGP